jgi:AcrR family transcriptional regulator
MSSSSAVVDPPSPTRRRVTARQADTIDGLVAAAVDEIREEGYDGLTVRNVARRAGVAPATAYTYFASKDHLVAEAYWRRLQALEPMRFDGRWSPARRAAEALRQIALLVADEPALSSACTAAMLSNDPDVAELRDRIGADVHRRLAAAVGDVPGAAARTAALDLLFTGALVQVGTGHLSYDAMADRLAEAAALTMGRNP